MPKYMLIALLAAAFFGGQIMYIILCVVFVILVFKISDERIEMQYKLDESARLKWLRDEAVRNKE